MNRRDAMRHFAKALFAALALVLIVSSFQLSFADEVGSKPTIYIEASEPDENGYFDVDVSLENATFLVYEIALRYNASACVPVNPETGEPTDAFADFGYHQSYDGVNYIGEKLDTENGYFLFTSFVMPETEGDIIKDSMAVSVEKTTFCTFSFKKISDEDIGLAVASIYDGGVYDEVFPDGAFIASRDTERYVADVKISYGETEKTSETVYYSYSELHPTKYTKELRLQNTVYVTVGDYAAAVDGKLAAIDADNHSVMPYEKDGDVYLPLRFICESLGAEVGWDEETGMVSARSGERVSLLDTASGVLKTDGDAKAVKAEIVYDRTFVTGDVINGILGTKIFEEGSEIIVYDSIVEWDESRQAEKDALEAMRYVMMPLFRMFI